MSQRSAKLLVYSAALPAIFPPLFTTPTPLKHFSFPFASPNRSLGRSERTTTKKASQEFYTQIFGPEMELWTIDERGFECLGGAHSTKGSQKVRTLLNKKWVLARPPPPPSLTYAVNKKENCPKLFLPKTRKNDLSFQCQNLYFLSTPSYVLFMPGLVLPLWVCAHCTQRVFRSWPVGGYLTRLLGGQEKKAR